MTNTSHTLNQLKQTLPLLKSIEQNPNTHQTNTPTKTSPDPYRIPFGIIIETPETNHPKTSQGINMWALKWYKQFHHYYPKEMQNKNPLDALNIIHQRAQNEQQEEWDIFEKELNTIWAAVAYKTGYAPIKAGYCHCGHPLWQQPQQDGIPDWLICSGPNEHFYKNRQHYAQTILQLMQTVTQPHYLPANAIRAIHPHLHRQTLSKWVHAGKIERDQQGRYNLAQINQQAGTITQLTSECLVTA